MTNEEREQVLAKIDKAIEKAVFQQEEAEYRKRHFINPMLVACGIDPIPESN